MATITEKKFGGTYGLRYQVISLGNEREAFIDYGPSLGSQRFTGPDAEQQAIHELDGWSEDRINDLTNQLAAMTKLRRWLAKQ